MPVAYAFDVLGGDSGWWTLTKWLAVLSVIWGLRTWSKGYRCREQKELAGKTYLLTVRAHPPPRAHTRRPLRSLTRLSAAFAPWPHSLAGRRLALLSLAYVAHLLSPCE